MEKPSPALSAATNTIQISPTPIRWIAVVLLMNYGFAKLNGSQFTILDSELAKPMGEVSGAWLTWYYFGFSQSYGNLIALVQIGGAALLAFRRTALLGALLLLPMVVNIVLIDIFFEIDAGATLVAMLIVALLAAVVAPQAGRLWTALVSSQPPTQWPWPGIAVGTIAAAACALTFWIANYNNRRPTAIDGAWTVATAPDSGQLHDPVSQIFFERNRIALAVFRSQSGRDELHHFELGSNGEILVWQQWLLKGELLFQGSREADGALRLRGTTGGYAGRTLVLSRAKKTRLPNPQP